MSVWHNYLLTFTHRNSWQCYISHISIYPSCQIQCIWQEGFFMELQKDINVCKPSEQGYCPAVLFPVWKLSFSAVGSMLGFGMSALCLQPSELVTDAFSFGRCIPFFLGGSAAFCCFAFPLGKLTVILFHYGFWYRIFFPWHYTHHRFWAKNKRKVQ